MTRHAQKLYFVFLALTMAPLLPAEADVAVAKTVATDSAPHCVHWNVTVSRKDINTQIIVRLNNRCKHVMRCEVKAGVNMKPRIVVLQPRKSDKISFFVGSPGSKFKTHVKCRHPLSAKPWDASIDLLFQQD